MRRTHYRTCPLCEATCGLAIETEEGRVASIRGDADDVFSRGYICPKAAALADLHDDPDRLRSPLRRTGSSWQPIAWDDAFDQVAHRLKLVQKAYGRDAVATYQGNPTAHNLGLLTFGQLLLRRLGTRNQYSATSADQLPHMLSSLTMFGSQVLLPVPDVDRTHHMMILGGNPLVSNGSLMTAPGIKRRLQALRARGGRLVVVDPRRTETAQMADEHLFLRPGTDALLLLAMLQVFFADGLASAAHLQPHAVGLEKVRRACADVTPELVAGPTGLPADVIRRLAREFAAAPSAVCYGRIGTCTQEFGGLSSWLINLVNIVTGNLDRAGGAMFATPAIDLATAAGHLGLQGSFGSYHSRVSGLPEFGGELPVSVLAEEIVTPGQGRIRALITSAGNPVLSTPNGARLERALESLDFMVSIDPYLNETTRHADIILPPTSALEHDHYDLALYLVSVRNIANYSPAIFPRTDDQRHDWEICAELASRMETSEKPWGRAMGKLARAAALRIGPRGALAAGLRLGPYKRLTLKKLEANPHGVQPGPAATAPARRAAVARRQATAGARSLPGRPGAAARTPPLRRRRGDRRAGADRPPTPAQQQLVDAQLAPPGEGQGALHPAHAPGRRRRSRPDRRRPRPRALARRHRGRAARGDRRDDARRRQPAPRMGSRPARREAARGGRARRGQRQRRHRRALLRRADRHRRTVGRHRRGRRGGRRAGRRQLDALVPGDSTG